MTCICFPTDPATWEYVGDVPNPQSQIEWNPYCPVHFIPSEAYRDQRACPQRQRAALGATAGICRALNPDRTFMCDLDAGHDCDHSGFELPTIALDEGCGHE